MAHWIIEDKGFGGLVFNCSNCGASWNDIFHSEVGCWDKCPSCGEEMDEEREYVEEKLVENPFAKIRNISENVAKATIAYQNMGDAIRRIDENVMTLEQVSGMSIENLIKLFSAGWTLKEPEVVTGLHAFEINESIAKEINDRIRRGGYLRAGEPVIRRPWVVNTGHKFDENLLKRQLEDQKIHGCNLTGLEKAGIQRGMRAKICMVDDLAIDFEERPEESEE